MRGMTRGTRVASASLIGALLLALSGATWGATAGNAATGFTVTSRLLAAPAGTAQSYPAGINSTGQVAGVNLTYRADRQITTAYVSAPLSQTMTDLGSLGFDQVDVKALTDAGHLAGTGTMPPPTGCTDPLQCRPDTHAFRWHEQTGVQDLGTLGGTQSDVGGRAAVNETGQVVGYSSTADGSYHGFLSTPGSPMLDLGTLAFGSTSSAHAINASGVVAGQSGSSNGERAVIWTLGAGGEMVIRDLGALPPGSGPTYSSAVAINDAGQVAGISNVDNSTHAFLWSQADGMQDLGTLDGSPSSTVVDLSETGQVVGQSGVNNQKAYSWTAGSGMVDLGSLAPDAASTGAVAATYVADVNERGEVAGASTPSNSVNGLVHPFWWTPNTGLVDLTPDATSTTRAVALNNVGEVIGGTTVWTVTAVPPPPPPSPSSSPTPSPSTSPSPAPNPDADGDGILDTVDADGGNGTNPGAFSDAISGQPATSGQRVDAGGVSVGITDVADPAGVRISVGSDGPGPAVFTVCAGGFRLELPAGSSATITCGSVTVKDVTGSRDVTVTLPGGLVSLAVSAGDAMTADVTPGGYTVSGVTGSVLLTTDGVSRTLGAADHIDAKMWDFVGFASPLKALPEVNVVKAGQTVPLKWRLLDTAGQPVTTLASVSLQARASRCAPAGSTAPIEATVTAASRLQNLGGGYYQLDVKTVKLMAGICVRAMLDLGDGVTHDAAFRLR